MRNLSYREMKYFQTLVVYVVVIKSSCDPGCWLLSHSYPLQCCCLTTTPRDSHVSPQWSQISANTGVLCGVWRPGPWGCNGLFRPLDLRVTPVGIIRGSSSSRVWSSDPLVTSPASKIVFPILLIICRFGLERNLFLPKLFIDRSYIISRLYMYNEENEQSGVFN